MLIGAHSTVLKRIIDTLSRRYIRGLLVYVFMTEEYALGPVTDIRDRRRHVTVTIKYP